MTDVDVEILSNFRLLTIEQDGKRPTELAWESNARKRPKKRIEQILRTQNVGILCGDGLVVVDIDVRNGGLKTAQELGWVKLDSDENVIEKNWPKTPRVKTPSGGFHLYFSGSIPATKIQGIDIQSTGRQVVAPPSKTPSGVYVWEVSPIEIERAPLPPEIIDAIKKYEEKKNSLSYRSTPSSVEYDSTEWPRELIIDALDHMRGHNIPYNDWLRIGMALKNAGYDYDIWDRFNMTLDDYTPQINYRKWESFSLDASLSTKIITMLAKERGWKPEIFEMPDNEHFINISNDVGPLKKNIEEKSLSKVDIIAQEFIDLRDKTITTPPRLSMLIDAISDYSDEIQPRFCRATAVVILSWLFFSVSTSVINSKTHAPLSNFTVLVGGSGTGKGFFSNLPSQLINLTTTPYRAEEFQSTHSILRSLKKCNARIIPKNEIAMMLQSSKDDIVKNDLFGSLCSIWSGERLAGKEAKDKKDSLPGVNLPLCCLFGGCTVTQFKDFLDNKNFNKGGLFYRIDFVFAEETNIKKDTEPDEEKEFNQQVLALIKKKEKDMEENAKEAYDMTMDDYLFVPKKLAVLTKDARAELKKIRDEYKNKAIEYEKIDAIVLAGLMNRMYEKICRASCCVALWETEVRPAPVTIEMVRWSHHHYYDVINSLKQLSTIANQDTEHGKLCESIVLALKNLSNGEKKRIKYSDMRTTNIGKLRGAKPHDILQALIDLSEIGKILVEKEGKTRFITLLS